MTTASRVGVDIVAQDRTAQAFASATRSMRQFDVLARSFSGVFATLGATLSLGGLVAGLKSAVDRMDELGKAAQRAGVPVEQFSALAHAAKNAGVSIGTLEAGFGNLNKSLSDISVGGSGGRAGVALRAMGVAAVDSAGKLRPISAILADVAGKFSGYADGASKGVLAQALFKDAGLAMIPMLNEGRDALASAAIEAQRFGLLVGEDVSQASAEFNDQLTRMNSLATGVAQQIISQSGLLNVFSELTDKMYGFVDASPAVNQALRSMDESSSFWATKLNKLYGGIRHAQILAATLGAYSNRKTRGLDKEATQVWEEGSEKINDVWAEINGKIVSAAQRAEWLSKSSLPASIDVFGKFDQQKSQPPGIRLSEPTTTRKKTDPDISKAKSLYESTMKPLERFTYLQGEYSRLLSEGHINQTTFNRAVDLARSEYVSTEGAMRSLSVTAADSFDVFEGFGDTIENSIGKAFDDATNKVFSLKDSLLDLTKSLASSAFKKSLSSVFDSFQSHPLYGGGGGGFFSSLFGGLPGFAEGGSFKVGGSGLGDSQLVQFRARPDEIVSVSRDGSGAGNGAVPALTYSQSIVIQGNADPKLMKSVLDGAMVQVQRELPSMIRAATRSGDIR